MKEIQHGDIWNDEKREGVKKTILKHKLVEVAFKIDDKLKRQQEKSDELKEMARLAKAGLKDTEEFKQLDIRYKHPTVIDFSDEMKELQSIVKKLR